MTDAVRLDKWLWAARFFKTRAVAQQAIRGGKVEINDSSPKASRLVRAGDRLKITKGELRFEVIVEQLGEKRVSAPLARAMYAETEAGRTARLRQIEQQRQARAAGGAPARAPDKRARRALRKLKGGG